MGAMIDYLRRYEEPMPDWLATGRVTLENFFESRTVFYPGAGNDGQAISVFNRSRTAHCFVYADYDYSLNKKFLAEIVLPMRYPKRVCTPYERRAFKGYRWSQLYSLDSEELGWNDSNLWISALTGDLLRNPLALLAIYERLPDFSEDHGGERIAVLFVGAEASALCRMVYGRLFPHSQPFAILLQDHGFGRNSCGLRFRNPDGQIAKTVSPRFLLVGRGGSDEIWRGCKEVRCRAECGGMHAIPRRLYERSAE